MNISLKPEHEKYLREKVAQGVYASANDAICDGLAHLIREDELNRKVREAQESMRAGRLVDGQEVFRRAYERLDGLESRAAERAGS